MAHSQYFFVNGQKYFSDTELTISKLLTYFNYKTSLFVIEYNNQICNKQTWDKTYICANAHIEIVTIVGGG